MKLKDGYILREIAGDAVLIPVGRNALEFNGIIALNPVSADIWKWIQDGCSKEELLESILEEYDVSRTVAKDDLDAFLEQLRQLNILDVSE